MGGMIGQIIGLVEDRHPPVRDAQAVTDPMSDTLTKCGIPFTIVDTLSSIVDLCEYFIKSELYSSSIHFF